MILENSSDLVHDLQSCAASRHADRLSLLRTHVDTHLGEPLDLASLCAISGLSKIQLISLFKTGTGQTPHQFVLSRRFAAAERMLLDARLPLAEIAYALGFSSQSHFTSSFRRSYGVSPGQLRRRLRSEVPFDWQAGTRA